MFPAISPFRSSVPRLRRSPLRQAHTHLDEPHGPATCLVTVRRLGCVAAVIALLAVSACGDDSSGPADDAKDADSDAAQADGTARLDAGEQDGAADANGLDASSAADAASGDPSDEEPTDATTRDDAADVMDGGVDAEIEETPPQPLRVTLVDSLGAPVVSAPIQFDAESGGASTVATTDSAGRVQFSAALGKGTVTAIAQNNLGHREIMSIVGVGPGQDVLLRPTLQSPFAPIPLCPDPTNVIVGHPETPLLVPHEVPSSSCTDDGQCGATEYCNLDEGAGLPVPNGVEGACYYDGAAQITVRSTCGGSRCPVIRPPALSHVACVCESCVADQDANLQLTGWAVDDLGGDVGFSTVVLTGWDSSMTSGSLGPWLTVGDDGVTPVSLDVANDIQLVTTLVGAQLLLTGPAGTVSRSLSPTGSDVLNMRSLFAAAEIFSATTVRFYLHYAGGTIEALQVGLPADDWTRALSLSDSRLVVFDGAAAQDLADPGFQLGIDFVSDRAPTNADALWAQVSWEEGTDIACLLDDPCTATTTCNTVTGFCEERVTWRVLADPSVVVAGQNQITLPVLGPELAAIYTYSDNATAVALTALEVRAYDFLVGFAAYADQVGYEVRPPTPPVRRVEIVSTTRL